VEGKIKHIFFDLDHTLWDFDRNSKLAFEALFHQYNIELDLAQFLAIYEPINYAYWAKFRVEEISKLDLRRGRLSDSFAHFELIFSQAELDAMAEAYIEELPKNNYLFDGVIQTLDELKPQYELHIITNGFHGVQHNKIQKSGLMPYFSSVTTSEEVGLKKPNPVIFQKALEKAQAKPQESLMVGDTFEADILGAEAIGMHTLFYNYWSVEVPAQYNIIGNIREIKLHL
jgi:putative hydrolase of the HAD superfamily